MEAASLLGVANGTQKIVDLGNFWSDLEISEAFVVSHEVSFFMCFFPSRSLAFFFARSRRLGFAFVAEVLWQKLSRWASRVSVAEIKQGIYANGKQMGKWDPVSNNEEHTNLTSRAWSFVQLSLGLGFLCTESQAWIFGNHLSLGLEFLNNSLVVSASLGFYHSPPLLFNAWLVSGCEQKVFRLYFSWTRGRLSEMLKCFCNDFIIKNIPKMNLVLPFAI